ncbi:hypothetical protein P171DRAFT_523882 [Karstenula rhodostoma CBS 690.94]|uniref:Secreted protein n=1 Tax=Karstenula rhodostoma CBS 690.94 TaxID=1392251 RepID=A0A9P4P9F5_9PLEO|nr:hypothetical protein P171DRAFT_523882 [Karstenula rhodostoma CBS 690.94]
MLLYYCLFSLYALLVSADFDIYLITKDPDAPGFGVIGWQVVDPTRKACPDPARTRMFSRRTDVSGNKIGIRCVSETVLGGCEPLRGSYPNDIGLMEMHFSDTPKIHYTIYRSGHGKPWEMVGLQGEPGGYCEPAPWPPSDQAFSECGPFTLWKKMRCHSFLTADYINDYNRGWHP